MTYAWRELGAQLGDYVTFRYHGDTVGVIVVDTGADFLGQELWHTALTADRTIWYLGGIDTTPLEIRRGK